MPNSSSSHRADQSDGNEYYCIFLHIVEGVGFNPHVDNSDFNHDKIVINASLNNIKFEVEGQSLSKDSATIFNNFCVWECQLKDIKRMKTDNRPVKIECFYKPGNDEFSFRKAIGTLLLPVRGVQPLRSLRNVKLKMNWHKLGTLSTEWRKTKPEICLMMIIAKKELIETGELEELIKEGRKSGTSKLFSPGRSETAFMLQSQSNVYIQLLEHLGVIQIGNNPEIDCDTFHVTLTFKQVRHIEKLMEFDTVYASNRGDVFIFCYDLLGKPSSLEILINRFDCYSINDKITLSFRASSSSLRSYFQRVFYMPVTLYYGGKAVATYRMDFDKLMPDDAYLDLNQSWTKNGTFFFDHLYKSLSPRTPKPSVSFCFTVQQLTFNGKRYVKEKASKNLVVPYQSSDIPIIDTKLLNTASDSDKNTTQLNNLAACTRGLNFPALENKTESLNDINIRCSKEISTVTIRETVEIGIQVEERPEPCPTCDENKKAKLNEEELIYNVVQELEEWKKQEMLSFEQSLREKEKAYLTDIRGEWDKERAILRARLEAKMAQCEELNAKLERANAELRMNAAYIHDNTNFAEKLKCEIECNYSTKFAMLEQQIDHLKVEITQKDTLFEIQLKATKIEIEKLEQEKSELEERITEMENNQSVRDVEKDSEKLKALLEELKMKSERCNEMERSKNYYKKKFSKSNLEVQQMRMTLLEQRKKETGNGFNECLETILSEEKDALDADRSELNTIKESLLSISSNSEFSETDS